MTPEQLAMLAHHDAVFTNFDRFDTSLERFERKLDTIEGLQREANGRVATTIRDIAVLNERTLTMKDNPARLGTLIAVAVSLGTLIKLVFTTKI